MAWGKVLFPDTLKVVMTPLMLANPVKTLFMSLA